MCVSSSTWSPVRKRAVDSQRTGLLGVSLAPGTGWLRTGWGGVELAQRDRSVEEILRQIVRTVGVRRHRLTIVVEAREREPPEHNVRFGVDHVPAG